MKDSESIGQQLLKGTGQFVGHAAALVAGLVLILAGAGMGVSLVLLPVGIPVGLLGLLLVLWGLFGYAQETKARKTTIDQK